MSADDPDFVAELVQDFLRDGPSLIAAVEVGVRDGDAEGVRRAAHTLKSNAPARSERPVWRSAAAP